MKRTLPSGVVMDITPNDTGGYDVQVTCPPKTYANLDVYLQDKYDTIKGALIALKKEGIFSGAYQKPRISNPPVSGIEIGSKPVQKKPAASKQKPKPKQGAKVIYSSPLPKPAYAWEPPKAGSTQIPSGIPTYETLTPEEGESRSNHAAPILPPTIRVGEFLLRHPGIAAQIGEYRYHDTNISTNAQRFAENAGFPKEGEAGDGTHWNAIRHTVWQATIASKFGESIAKEAGDAHEDNPNADLSKRKFMGKDYKDALAKADETIDLLNNVIGREIGKANPNIGMKELAIRILKYYHEQGLYMAKKVNDNESDIAIVRLTDEEYNTALEIYNTVDENGFTPIQQEQLKQERTEEKLREEKVKRIINQFNPPNFMP